jgi:hypothetical protein
LVPQPFEKFGGALELSAPFSLITPGHNRMPHGRWQAIFYGETEMAPVSASASH